MTLTELSIVVCELTKLVAATVELDDGLITTPLDVWLDAWIVTVVVDNADRTCDAMETEEIELEPRFVVCCTSTVEELLTALVELATAVCTLMRFVVVTVRIDDEIDATVVKD